MKVLLGQFFRNIFNPIIANSSMRKCFKLLCVLVFSLFSMHLQAQSRGNDVSFSVKEEKLSSALHKLSNASGLNFSYNASDSVFQKKTTYSVENEHPLIILENLLVNTNKKYKQVGNQVVIYNNPVTIDPKNKFEEPLNTGLDDKPNMDIVVLKEKEQVPIFIIDTLYISDTVFRVLVDTIRINDTVIIERSMPLDTAIIDLSRESGWAVDLFVAPILSDFTMVRESSAFSLRNFSLGFDVVSLLDRWNISAGIRLTQFSEKFNHSYSISEGGYFVTDTVDSYYTLVVADTNWYYVTDSTWKPVSNTEYNYNVNNRVGMLELALSSSYDFYVSSSIRLYAKVGIKLGTVIYKKGVALPDPNNPEGVDLADLNFNTPSFSVYGGIGVKYKINKSMDFNSELYYMKYTSQLVENYPSSIKIDGVGLKVGLILYLN